MIWCNLFQLSGQQLFLIFFVLTTNAVPASSNGAHTHGHARTNTHTHTHTHTFSLIPSALSFVFLWHTHANTHTNTHTSTHARTQARESTCRTKGLQLEVAFDLQHRCRHSLQPYSNLATAARRVICTTPEKGNTKSMYITVFITRQVFSRTAYHTNAFQWFRQWNYCTLCEPQLPTSRCVSAPKQSTFPPSNR